MQELPLPATGLAANSKSGPIAKLEDNTEQLPSAKKYKEKLPEKGLEGGGAAVVVGGAAVVVSYHWY